MYATVPDPVMVEPLHRPTAIPTPRGHPAHAIVRLEQLAEFELDGRA